jgi:hypothetical protein
MPRGTRPPYQQIPEYPEKKPRKLGEQQTIHKNNQKDGERKKPQEKRIRKNLLLAPRHWKILAFNHGIGNYTACVEQRIKNLTSHLSPSKTCSFYWVS